MTDSISKSGTFRFITGPVKVPRLGQALGSDFSRKKQPRVAPWPPFESALEAARIANCPIAPQHHSLIADPAARHSQLILPLSSTARKLVRCPEFYAGSVHAHPQSPPHFSLRTSTVAE